MILRSAYERGETIDARLDAGGEDAPGRNGCTAFGAHGGICVGNVPGGEMFLNLGEGVVIWFARETRLGRGVFEVQSGKNRDAVRRRAVVKARGPRPFALVGSRCPRLPTRIARRRPADD